jgi:hypothetical protein
MCVGLEPQTARFEVQILGDELLSILRCIPRQYVAFYVPFYPPVGIEPLSKGLTTPLLLKMAMFYQ